MSSRTRALQAAAGLGVALATGFVVDRRLGARARRRASEGAPLGSLRGEAHTVVASDGVKLYAEVDERSPYTSSSPRADGVTVVFAHGFALSLDCWHYQRQAFRGRRRMVFYDQRSHGRSDLSDEDHLLVGHSMGGMSVVALAEQHPELFGDRVVGVGLISTTAGGMRAHKILSRYVPDALGRRAVERGLIVASHRQRLLELARKRGSALSLWVIREFAFGKGKVPPEHVVFLDDMIGSTPLQVLVEFIPRFDALDKFSVVRSFDRVPTTIMCGTSDKLTSVGHSRKLHKHIDGSRLVELEDGGHMPILEFPETVNDALDQLFRDADANAGLS